MTSGVEKGFLYLTIANLAFVISGYVVYFGLARIVPVAQFGIYGLIISFVTMITFLFTGGMQQAISKFVAEDEERAELVKRKALKLVFAVSLAVFLGVFFLAETIALLLNDPSLTPFIQVISVVVVTHALYATFLGYFNGMKQFRTQAMARIIHAIMKVVFIFGLTFLTLSIFGALVGFVLASAAACLVSFLWARPRKVKGTFSTKELVKFSMPLVMFVLVINIVLNLDLLALKALSEAGISGVLVGYYAAAVTLSRIPFFVVTALSVVIFPVISASVYMADFGKVRMYIKNANRYALILLAPIVLLISSTSAQLVNIVYPAVYSPAALPLSILIFGLGFFALFNISTAVISGSGKPKVSMIVAVAMLICAIVLNFTLIPIYGMVGAALATTAASFIAMVLSIIYVYIRFSAVMSLKSFFRIAIAALAVYAVSFFIVLDGILLILTYAVLIAVYFGLLAVMREFTNKDLAVFMKLISRDS